MTDFVDSTHDAELKRDLARLTPFLPGTNDRNKAASLARWPREFSSPQRFFAKQLIDRASKFQRAGSLPASADSLWDDDSASAPQAPLGKAASAPASSGPSVVEVNGADLQACVERVLAPGLEAIKSQLDASAQARQDTFNRVAAKAIAEQVLRAALEELEKRKPREVNISVARDDVTRSVEGLKHKRLADAMAVVAAGIPLLLVGPAGSGKSTAGEQIAQAFGTSFYLQGAASGTHEYLGYKDGGGTYHSTPFRQAFEHGGLFMAEELDSGSADVPLILNAGLANGHMAFPDSVNPVPKHKEFRIIANANTYGNGADRIYVGRTQLDGATIDRFAFLDWNYDEDLERACANNADWTTYVQRVRAAVLAEKARIIVSPRASINGGKLLAQGLPRAVVCDMVLWKGVDSELRKRVEARVR
jgi:cobaltochelatase CobS